MSDFEENARRSVIVHLHHAYLHLVAVCANLPVPISLPEDFEPRETVAVLERVAEISDDQPMPEDQQADLFTGAIMILAATDLVAAMNARFVEWRPMAAMATLEVALDALHDLMEWQAEND
ncbi:hypothetical protein [Streptomyces sp. SID3212]|uniref:hypothetical protein n=1 Tax=Streptomyces sp. SID3212 TaxID=2690259 RepID=UPI00136E360E|nr:hypothetical protein [Streptomyces sp. SID3212]MYV56526.1 hypothetical protein [Streptomyces sp. SID3212]